MHGGGYMSDVSIDDVKFTMATKCSLGPLYPTDATPPPPSQPPTPVAPSTPVPAGFNCDFDKGLCSWYNDVAGDDFNWAVQSGGTTEVNAGPDGDHTSGE